jgi:hypothetical protein
VWSSFGGAWHRVRVRYPRFWPHYGRPLSILLLRSAIYLVAGGLLEHVFGRPAAEVDGWGDRITLAGALLALILLGGGLYNLVRSLLDLALVRTITGEVLWQETWLSKSGGEDNPSIPWLDYLAVDDGGADRTTAWGLPIALASRCRDGDVVTIRVRPWSRRIGELTVVGQGRARRLVETVTAEDTGKLALRMMTPAAPAAPLFGAGEVGQMLGRPVTSSPLPLAGVQWSPVDGGSPLLMVQSVQGLPGRVAWRANSRGQEVPGVGDGAFVDGPRAALRHGDTTVVLTLLGDGRARQSYLPWLLSQAVIRS